MSKTTNYSSKKKRSKRNHREHDIQSHMRKTGIKIHGVRLDKFMSFGRVKRVSK